MIRTRLTSKERILNTINRLPVDHLPLVFEGICHGRVQFITNRIPNPMERARYYLDLGVDTGINLYPPRFTNQDIVIKDWREHRPGEKDPILTREYQTPAGNLRQVVRKDADYPETVLLLDDLNVPPDRSLLYLVESEADLASLAYILKAPDPRELESYYRDAGEIKKFCNQNQILLCATLDGIGDPLLWLSGVEKTIFAAIDNPEFLQQYIEIIAKWNLGMLNILIASGVDVIIRRGWYESTDFWSPRLYQKFLFQPFKKEIEIAHQAGVKVTYVMNSGTMPLLKYFPELGFDIFSNIEPEKTNMSLIKQSIGSQIALCGGVNNYHAIEQGSQEQVDESVRQAIEILGPGAGFILAPSDSILSLSETAQRNFFSMVETWKQAAVV